MGWMEEFEKAVNEQKNAAKKKKLPTLVRGTTAGGAASGWMEEYRKAVEAVTAPPQQGSGYFQKGALSTGNVGRAILGTGTDVGTDLLGGIVGMGETALDALVQLSPYLTNPLDDRTVVGLKQQQAETQMRETMKKDAAEFVSKDLYDEQAVARKILSGVSAGMELAGKTQAGMQLTAEDLDRARANQKRAEAYMENDMELDSVLGQKSDALVGSLGQMMGTGALQALGVPTWLTMGLTSYGGEAENALKSGASYEEATGSALISAGAEVLSEKLFGGSGLGEKGLIDLDHLTRGISNKLAKTLADYGVDMAAEGFEEVFSEVAGNLGSALYREESLKDILASEEAFEAYLDAFISGGAVSGILNAPKAASHAKKGTDYRADFTQNEQKVVDKVYHDRLVELEKKGDVSAREKSRLYKDVSRDMEKGYISTDTIEEVLGGEAKTAYDSLRKEAQEYQTLYDTESGRLSERQKDRLAELKKKNEANPYETALKTAGDQLSGDVFGLVKGERLAESYNEKTRRGQNFEADLSRYDKKYHQTIQNAIDSGMLNNTNRSHELVDFIAKISADKGIPFDFTNNEKLRQTQFAVEGKTVNGYKTDTGITLNVQSPKYLETTVGHEIAHVLEGTELYDTLSEAAKNYAISKEGLDGYNARVKAAEELYRGVKGANPDGEVVADLVGEYIFSDTDFVGRLSTGNRDLFDRIFDEIKYLCRVVTTGSKEARQLEKVKKAFEEAYRTEIKNPTGDGGVKYSLTEYSEQQKKNWSTSKRIVIYDNPQQLSQFIQDSVTNKTMDKKMYFGAIPSDLATRIESDAGVNVENYNLSLGSYEIRKILKDHGNEATESPRGQRAIVEDDFAHIVDIVLNPKNIALSDDTYMGKPAIIFTGEHNGRMNVVAVVSDKRLDLFVQTVFVNVKKGNLSTPIGEQAPINTPEANNGTVSNIKITQSGNGVKSQLSLSDTNSMPRGRGTLGRDIMYAPAAGESSAVPNADNAAPNAENVLANAENALPDAAAAKNASAESPYEGIPIRSDIPQRATEDIGPVRSDLTAPAEKASAPMRDIGPVRADIGQTAGQGSGGTRMKERSWAETATGSEAVGGAIRKEDLDPDKLYYQPISNRKTLENANALLDRQGYEAAVPYFNMKLADRNVSLDDVALGERLIQEALKRGDTETAAELIQNVSILGTELGQKVQALSIIKRLTPEGQLMMLQKTVERGKTKGDKAFDGVEISQEMKDKILGVYNSDGTFDQDKLNAAVEEVKQQIADTMKVGAWEKVNAWRYLSMLGNPKTHIRNLVSNVAMKGAVAAKNAAARTIESVVRPENRTKTWKKATTEVRDFSDMKMKEMKDIITGDGKYSESADIKEKRAVFKNKVLNGVYELNSELLSKEDWWFSGPAFKNSLSEFLTANGIRTQADMDARPETVEKGIQYAVEQAQIATFQQYSKLASMISSMERSSRGMEIAVGAVLPFKKTPINVAKTGLSYSPLGFAKTLTYDVSKVRKGEMEASTMIDHLAQNLTGTALTLAGYLLAKAGFLNGAGEDDREGKYDYQLGEQAYSVNIGGATYSLAWLSPVAMPLFVGANAYELLVAGEEWNPDVVIEALGKTIDPLSEMSFLSSLNDMLSSYDSGVQKFFGIGESMVESYLGQFIPTLFSQVATVMDDTKRSTKMGADSGFKSAQRIRNQLVYKIPFLRQTLEPSTDIWGNDVKQTENVLTRAFETFLAPYSKRADITSNVDVELKRLYGVTGDTGLLPSVPGGSFSYRGEKYKMSEGEYTTFKHTYGQSAGGLMKKLFATDAYRNADAETKADMVNQVYDYAMDEARKEYLAGKGLTYTNATVSGTGDKRYYKENSIKAAVERNLTLDEFDFSVKYPEKYKIAKAVGGYEDYIAYKEDMKDMDLGEKADYISALELTTQQKNILINGETDRKEPIDLTGYENYSSFEEFEYARNNPENYAVSKAVGGYDSYKQYASDLNDIQSDKDEYGKSIIGSRKKKVLDYINNLDADYGTKLILFKSEYTSHDDENERIVEYLNSKDELSSEEKRTILLKLGFKVDATGNISW